MTTDDEMMVAFSDKPSLDSIREFEESLFGADDTEFLAHYGKKHFSGRYPEGSGENPYQHCGNFIHRYDELRKAGLTEKQIAESMHIKITKLRNMRLAANMEAAEHRYEQCRALREKGYSLREIARQLGYANESSVRSALNENSKILRDKVLKTRDFLQEQVDEKGFIDIGPGVEHHVGITRTRMDLAIDMLKSEGYHVYAGRREQVTNPDKLTTFTYLAAPDKEHKEIFDPANHHTIDGYETTDDGETFKVKGLKQYPESLDSSRVMVKYKEEGGKDKDGVVEIRRGVDDLSLGPYNYAQVRILVDGTHYVKGMAVYADDLPDGIDIRINSNKPVGTPLCGEKDEKSVLKNIKLSEGDALNPFGASIKEQLTYVDADGNEQISKINIRASEGDWGEWSNKIPSQFLAKQNQQLIDQQLKISLDNKDDQFESIKAIENPVLKKKMLMDYADACDSDACDLKAASLPRQSYQVILPVDSLKTTEVFAPNYKDGEQVALIRYPHGGIFEIPILTVNNKNQEGVDRIGIHAKDAVGINAAVGSQLSGADFDGDTVMVIPIPESGQYRISHKSGLPGLADFDPEEKFYDKPGIKHLTKATVQKEMGVVSNLIMDMTVAGATDEELARAVKHSMVVIDAVKHKYDYKLSEEVHNIKELKDLYQAHIGEDGKVHYGANTLITRAGSDARKVKTQGTPKIDPETGELIYKESDNAKYVDRKTGEIKYRQEVTSQMAITKDAHTLSTGTPVEEAFADYANGLKERANKARLEYLNTKNINHNPQARKEYAEEVAHLESMIKKAQMNAPRERQAQAMADAYIRQIEKDEGEKLDKKRKKKLSDQALNRYRKEVGAHRYKIEFTDREWEAIQKGALFTKSQEILFKYADQDKLIERATPRERKVMTEQQISRMNALLSRGYSTSDVAEAMGISTSTVHKYTN